MDDMGYSLGADLIAAERTRQIEKEGFTAENDDEYKHQLIVAATAYIMESYVPGSGLDWWPWDGEWWKPASRVENLVKAGALIAAELDRLARAGETL